MYVPLQAFAALPQREHDTDFEHHRHTGLHQAWQAGSAAEQVAVIAGIKLAFSYIITALLKVPSIGRYSQAWRWDTISPHH